MNYYFGVTPSLPFRIPYLLRFILTLSIIQGPAQILLLSLSSSSPALDDLFNLLFFSIYLYYWFPNPVNDQNPLVKDRQDYATVMNIPTSQWFNITKVHLFIADAMLTVDLVNFLVHFVPYSNSEIQASGSLSCTWTVWTIWSP